MNFGPQSIHLLQIHLPNLLELDFIRLIKVLEFLLQLLYTVHVTQSQKSEGKGIRLPPF